MPRPKKTEGSNTIRTKRVNVHESYEVPIDEESVDTEVQEVMEANPLQAFLDSLDENRSLVMHVYLLPNYAKDGLTSLRSVDRAFVTKFTFTVSDIDDYPARIQLCEPRGGTFQLELREIGRGTYLKRWEETIRPLAGYAPNENPNARNGYPPVPPPPVVINTSERQNSVAPVQALREQMNNFREMVEIVKDVVSLQPQQPVQVTTTNGEAGDGKPLEDRIVEGLIVNLVEGKGEPSRLERVIEMLGNRRNHQPTFMESFGPAIAELAKQFAPVIGQGIRQWSAQRSLSQPQQPVAQLADGTPPVQPEQQAPPQLDSGDRAWMRVVYRLCEDCMDNTSCIPASESILDLIERFPGRFDSIIQGLLNSQPAQVIDMCAMIMPPQDAAQIQPLKNQPIALTWIANLQIETRRVLGEASLEEGQPQGQ